MRRFWLPAFLVLGVLNPFVSFAQNCENEFRKDFSPAQIEAVQKRFRDYFQAANGVLIEREALLEVIQVALLAQEHVLLLGPPGNAKSMVADWVLGNILEATPEGEKAPSYYRIQMTPETTMSETHGPINPKEIFESGKIVRHYGEGMLLSRNVFIDEIFDSRANAQRNILGLLNERQHAQGTEIIKGKIETAIAASNRYLDEVYEKAGDDGPRALLDRFAFVVFVPGEFEKSSSYERLIELSQKRPSELKIPELTFGDLEVLREQVAKVEIPSSVGQFLSQLSYRMRGQTEVLEQGSLRSYRKKIQNGEHPQPPYRSTKYHSPRTLMKAANILRSFVVLDWIRGGGKRELRATVEDLKFLESFFTLNGPSADFNESLLNRSVNPYERSQLSSVAQERELFQEIYKDIAKEINEVVYQYAFAEIDDQVSGFEGMPIEKKREFARQILNDFLQLSFTHQKSVLQSDQTGKTIGQAMVMEFFERKIQELVGEEGYRSLREEVSKKVAESKRALEERRVRELAEKQEAAKREKREEEERIYQSRVERWLEKKRVQVLENIAENFVVQERRIDGKDYLKGNDALTSLMWKDQVILIHPSLEQSLIAIRADGTQVTYQLEEDLVPVMKDPSKKIIVLPSGKWVLQSGRELYSLEVLEAEKKVKLIVGLKIKNRSPVASYFEGEWGYLVSLNRSLPRLEVVKVNLETFEYEDIPIEQAEVSGKLGDFRRFADNFAETLRMAQNRFKPDQLLYSWEKEQLVLTYNGHRFFYTIDLKKQIVQIDNKVQSNIGFNNPVAPSQSGSASKMGLLRHGRRIYLNLLKDGEGEQVVFEPETDLRGSELYSASSYENGRIFLTVIGRSLLAYDLKRRALITTLDLEKVIPDLPTRAAVRVEAISGGVFQLSYSLPGEDATRVHLFRMKSISEKEIEEALKEEAREASQ